MSNARGKVYEIVEGTSEPQDFQLLSDGEAIDGTNLDIDLVVKQNTTEIDGVSVAWLAQAAGTVRVTGIESLAVGEYRARYLITDSNDKTGKIPSGREADRWVIVPE